jgi:hypothetical protein
MISDEFCTGRLSPEVTHFFFNSTHALISYLPAKVRNPNWSLHILLEDPQYVSVSLICDTWESNRLISFQAGQFLLPTFMFPCVPHEDLSSEPYPLMDMATLDPIWKWW